MSPRALPKGDAFPVKPEDKARAGSTSSATATEASLHNGDAADGKRAAGRKHADRSSSAGKHDADAHGDGVKREEDGASPSGGEDHDGDEDDGEGGGKGAAERRRKRSRKGLDKKYTCPQSGCGKSYSRAEHLYRHQLNREPPFPPGVECPLGVAIGWGDGWLSMVRHEQTRPSRSTGATIQTARASSCARTSARATASVIPRAARTCSARTTTS